MDSVTDETVIDGSVDDQLEHRGAPMGGAPSAKIG
jgi:hypothetical protein